MSESPPTDDPRPDDMRVAKSLVIVNTGHGKGKTTAALGMVMRAVAQGWQVAVVQFLKSGDWKVGEEDVAKRLLGVEWIAIGEGFTWESSDLTVDAAVAQEAWRIARNLIEAGQHRLVMLDEITYAMNFGWIDTADVVAAITGRPERVNIVLTGRDAPDAIVEVADTVTEMRKVKHAYDNGIVAKKGLDY